MLRLAVILLALPVEPQPVPFEPMQLQQTTTARQSTLSRGEMLLENLIFKFLLILFSLQN